MRTGLRWVMGGVILAGCIYAGAVHATPASQFSGTTVALGHFDEFDVSLHTIPADIWQSQQRTVGQSDVYVQSNVWQPGGTTGWHSHPGHSLIIVTAGTVTDYEGDDPSCTPHVYTVGQGFVDGGGDHVHMIRNEGNVEARTYAVQLIPAGAVRRIDKPRPDNCPF
jgi:hypothetical protein